MKATVHELQLTTAKRAPTMALFFKIDGPPDFAFTLCEGEASLRAAVHEALFGNAKPDAMTVAEVAGAMSALQESGNIDFEDGWLSLRTGVAEVAAFMMEKVEAADKEMRDADGLRYEQFNRANTAEAKYSALCTALVLALREVPAPLLSEIAAGKIP